MPGTPPAPLPPPHRFHTHPALAPRRSAHPSDPSPCKELIYITISDKCQIANDTESKRR